MGKAFHPMRLTAAMHVGLCGALACVGQQPVVVASPANDAAFTSSNFSGDMQHITVGRSVSLRTAHRLAKVYVTNPAVLYAYTASPNEVLLTSKQPGISSVALWDEEGGSQTYLFSSDIDTDTLRKSIKGAMPTEDIHVQAEEGRVVLTGSVSTAGLYDAAYKMAGLYSKDVSNTLVVNSSTIKQVRLKVRIVEVDRSKLDQFAFNFFSAGGNNLAQTTTTQFPTNLNASTTGSAGSASASSSSVGNKTVSVTNPLNFLLYSSQFNVGATLQDLASRQVLQILAEPTITTLSGEKANFLAGGEFPFPVVQGGAGGLTSITIQFRPYGVRLEFLPVVNPDGSIQLKVAPEVSALDYTNAVQISGYTIPAISTRRAETQVVLRSGQSFAISGLLDKRTTDQLGKTPGIASVPVLGALFKSKDIKRSTTEILVLVTPEIVDPMSGTSTWEEPKSPVPVLDEKEFDQAMPKIKPKS
ncbi:Flp pilus assembly protein, secretin CpaC [Terriglobus roseus DSM 18391]|uniref:Flp pilus assembly protein, secretin CpaC n=1 Tax=Terriglobus roseus (strain DSM 18391 / NRRL B-41598 / KBS 63) TaxID=926566 RepID=I3ZLI2_TERRK|nr:pilus assembly protein N-terminal domain-containing protein [Terriglobus roseus]AFL90100.1 Flp pilus assembly protein, secretin CpaC [Terriglobus roseus DSM 18391]